uniref:EF-hand domain-containing protein n=1 Tax=Globisporangium ultimum (strain ATCC 200006 / CBS 805.95 / DAOM BR144) TaxID=431595 RepID=K3WHU2_GLOUD
MGNTLQAALKDHDAFALVDVILPYDNLHINAVEAYWRSFYDVATSFALTKAQLRQICCRTACFLDPHASTQCAMNYADHAFELFLDPQWRQSHHHHHQQSQRYQQQQQLQSQQHPFVIDALEFFSAIAFVSASSMDEKIDLIFDSWDMSEDGALDLDEFTISLKSTLAGLGKILKPTSQSAATKYHFDAVSGIIDEQEVDLLADRIFREIANVPPSSSGVNQISITCEQFREYCTQNKTAKNLFEFFDLADASLLEEDGEEGDNSLFLEMNEEARLVHNALAKARVSDESSPSTVDISAEDHGDEFLAVKPWKGAIVPPSKIPPTLSKAVPLVSIKLDWIFGYSAQEGKNNVRYILTHGVNNMNNQPEEIVYPAAAACVVLNTKTMRQRHHLAHTDDVLCVCLHPKLPLAASGEIGRQPMLIVWDLVSTESKCILQGFHQRGILQIAFQTEELLVSIGGDDVHSVGIYESKDAWKSATLKIFAKGNKAVPFHLATKPASANEFVVCGQKYIEFWTIEAKAVISKKALLGKKGTLQPFLVAEYLKDTSLTVVGTNDGHLYLFNGRDLSSVVKAHNGAVNALHFATGALLSGGKDGQIFIWDEKLKQIGGPFCLADSVLPSVMQPQFISVRSCCFSPNRKTILLGTQASEIYEIDATNGQNIRSDALMRGHFHGELWGLDVHPHKQQCCTVGDDQMLRIWDLDTKKELRSVRLDGPGRACAYSSDGKLVAVGLGTDGIGTTGVNTKGSKQGLSAKNQVKAGGGFVVYSENDLTRMKEPCYEPRKWVSDVKFSPDNRVLAVASHDTKVYFYDVLKGFTKKQVFKKHSSYVTHIDFSSDGNYMQSTCEESDGTDVNAVDRSKDGTLLATGDDFGKVKVFRYPCALEKASSVELRGHASHVTNVRWSPHDHFIVSVGGNDRCVFVWQHEKPGNKAVEIDPYEDDDFTPQHAVGGNQDARTNRDSDPLEMASAIDDVGDEFMAVKPWLGAVVAPSSASEMNLKSTSPDAYLELERVHGYQAQNVANNARYDSNGKIIYHGAALGIIYDKSKQRQSFFKSHDDDIIGLCAHPNGSIFATAQMGKNPKIYTWNSSTGAALSCLEGFHQRFVSAICFSSDGKKLGSVGGDDDHSVAIYSWENGILTSSAKGERNNVLGMCFHNTTGEWITCGAKHIRFWQEQGKNLTSKKAIFGKAKHKDGKAPTAFECVVSFGKLVVAGASNGDLYVFQSSNDLSRIVTGHASNAFALYSSGKDGHELVSGGKDSKIMIWDSDVKPLATVDLKQQAAAVWLYNSSIRSVCTSNRSSRVFLVGTGGSDLLEVDASRSGISFNIITQGHYNMEVWGLACHPKKPEYCTVGDDQTLRVWCLNTKVQLRTKKLDCMARACAIDDRLDVIAVGYGGRNAQQMPSKASQTKIGSIVLFRYSDLAKLFEDKPSKQSISEVKFSPNGSVLAVGSHDHHIYLYKIHDVSCKKVTKTATFAKHQSYITHIDFSSDSKILQSNCGAYELLFSDATNGRHITSASSTKDTQWQTWTCVLGWPVQGIWPPCSDGTDVNAVDRNSKGNLLATSDDFGLVKLYRYPCVTKNASSTENRGHSSHVTNVRWNANDTHVISVGGNDRCIMEWKVMNDGEEEVSGNQQEALHEKFSTLNNQDKNDDDEDDEDNNLMDDPSGDEFMAVKPWVGAIVAPSNAPTPNSREPDLQLELDWVYGYQTELSHQNLVYNDRDEIVYHTAAVGIIYDPVTHLQRHHLCHNDDIISFAISDSKRNIVATGERGKKPVIRLWDAHTGELRCEMKGFHIRGVVSLAFSADMKMLVSVGDDDDHSVALWEDASNGSWTLAKLRATSKGDKGVNHFASFSSAGSSSAIVTGGAKHVLFWTIEGKSMTSKKGKVGKKGVLQNFPCGCVFGDEFVTGTASGELYVWRGGEVSRIVKAHEGETTVMYAHSSENLGIADSKMAATGVLLSGGKDGKVMMWNANFQSLKCFDLVAMDARCLQKAICSAFLSTSGQKLLIGTRSSDIIEMDVSSGTLLNGGKPLFSGHYNSELWGLAVHPSRREFVTTGDDGTLRVWDMETKQLTQLTRLSSKSRACAYSPDATVFAIGLGGDNGVRHKATGKQGGQAKSKEGAIVLLNAQTADAKVLFEDSPAKEWISDVKFSPCGRLVAFGSHDNAIYLYALSNGVNSGVLDAKKRKPFAKHNSYITHFDFSEDSKYIQSNCGAYEYLFCDTSTSEQVRSASSLKNVAWATWTCTLGWPVQGIWPECADGTDINAVCASSSRTILATGDDSSLVKIFRYPCTMKGSKFIAGRGHASHVTNVRFSCDDKFLISLGGNDRSIFQWKLT